MNRSFNQRCTSGSVFSKVNLVCDECGHKFDLTKIPVDHINHYVANVKESPPSKTAAARKTGPGGAPTPELKFDEFSGVTSLVSKKISILVQIAWR